MQKLFYIFLWLSFVFGVSAQMQVGDSARLSLITCSPGKAVYEQFGHTAIRYFDPASNIDLMFNYGIFNFNKPNFYGRFIKGETDYELGVYDSKYFFPEYQNRNSQVTEQVLNLSKEEKQRLLNALFTNYLPENREYRYNFIFDNCATRPRVKIENAVGGKVVYSPKVTEYFTFRHWIGEFTGFHTWTKFGIDLLLGKNADKIAPKMEATFLPDVLMREYKEAKIETPNGNIKPLIVDEKILVEKTQEKVTSPKLWQTPIFISLLVLLVGLLVTYIEFVKKRNWKMIDTLLLSFSGLVGIVVFYLMFFSVHPLVESNFNILWCNPVNCLLTVALWSPRLQKGVLFFQMANILLFAGAIAIYLFSIQHLNAASIPVIWLLLVRSAFWIYKSFQSKSLEK
ncbi:MAG: DUF4105 domain-containing protein [Paludibacteraceae bacterium]